jgi:hypothetical protein
MLHDNKPGTISRIAKKLAAENVNIEYAYLATAPYAEKGVLIFRPNDLKKAELQLCRSGLICCANAPCVIGFRSVQVEAIRTGSHPSGGHTRPIGLSVKARKKVVGMAL